MSAHLSSWLRRRTPAFWGLVQIAKSSHQLLKSGFREDNDQQLQQALKNYAKTFRDIGAALSEESGEGRDAATTPRVQPPLQLAHRNGYFAINMISSLQFDPDASSSELRNALDLGKRAVEYYAAAHAELDARPRARKGFVARIEHGDWCAREAELHASLAVGHLLLNEGDVSRSIETALAHYETALNILGDANLPELSAKVLASMGCCLLSYPTEGREAYARKAIKALCEAKQTLAPYFGSARMAVGEATEKRAAWLRRPRLWDAGFRGLPSRQLANIITPSFFGRLFWSLGIAYRLVGDQNKAIEHFEQALQIFPETHGEERAGVWLHKGLTYVETTTGSRSQNLTRALKCFFEALRLCDEETAPAAYALTLVRDVSARLEPELMARIKPESKEEVLRILTVDLCRASTIANAHGMHALRLEAVCILAKVYALRGDRGREYQALALASRIAERLYASARTPRLKGYVAGTRAVRLYDPLIRSAFEYAEGKEHANARDRVGHIALGGAERARTRFLQEHLAARDLSPKGALPGHCDEFFALRRQWVEAELRVLEHESLAPGVWNPEILAALWRRRNVLEARYFDAVKSVREQFNDPTFDPDQPITPVRYSDVCSMVDTLSVEKETALVEYYITDRSLVAFIVLPGAKEGSPVLVDTKISRDEIGDLAERWAGGQQRLREGSLHTAQWEQGYLAQTLARLQAAVEAPAQVLAKWGASTHRQIGRVIVVPHRFLHLVPLHAARHSCGTSWGELLCIQYAPSASVLCRLAAGSADFPDRPGEPSPVIVCHSASPTTIQQTQQGASLAFNTFEAQAVVRAMGGRVLEGAEATPSRAVEAMRQATYVHFACHGNFNPETPLETGLALAPESTYGEEGGENEAGERKPTTAASRGVLTLGSIFERVHLSSGCLVVLSACDTGLVRTEQFRDEYLGLPAGFLYAGATTVISTLWRVSDLATWLLVEGLAAGLATGREPAHALRRAQQRLRSMPAEYILKAIASAISRESEDARREQMCREAQRIRALMSSEPYPFQNPYWWAGFTVSGLGTALVGCPKRVGGTE